MMRRLLALGMCVSLTVGGCGFEGINSLPLPGTVGRGSDAVTYHVELANVGTLESNSPVMLDDVVVGSVGKMTVKGWHADVEVSVRPDVVVPANAVATVGQTSLLGSMHVALDPPVDQAPSGRLQPGARIGLDKSSTYPSTEQTLSSLSLVVNSGGLGQIGDIIHNFNAALSGRQEDLRELLTRLDNFVGTLDEQRGNIIATVEQLNRLANTFAAQRDVTTEALRKLPPALDVLLAERARFTTALDKLRVFSDTSTKLVNDVQADLVTNLQNLAPTIKAIADVGPELDTALAYIPVFPGGQNLIDRGLRGDYMNIFITADLTVNRLKRGLFLGTRWGREGLPFVPAPGDPGYEDYYSKEPLMVPMLSPASVPAANGSPVVPPPVPVSGAPYPAEAPLPAPAADGSAPSDEGGR